MSKNNSQKPGPDFNPELENVQTLQEEPRYKIGDVVSHSKDQYDATIHHWRVRLLPALKEVAAAIREAGMGSFSQELYQLVMENNQQRVRSIFEAQITTEIKKLSPILGKAISGADLGGDLIKAVLRKMENLANVHTGFSNGIIPVKVDFSHCQVKDGEIILDEDAVKASFSITIENEAQIKFLELLDNLVEPYNAVVEFMNQNGISRNFDIVGQNPQSSFTGEDESGRLEVYKDSINVLNGVKTPIPDNLIFQP